MMNALVDRMSKDIESRADIDAPMLRFYRRAMSDPLIGPLQRPLLMRALRRLFHSGA